MTVYGDRIVVIPPTTTTLPQSPAVIIIITVLLLISPHRHPFKCLLDERLLWFQAFMPKWCDGWIFSGIFFSLSFSHCFTEMGVRRMCPHVLVSLTYLPASWVSVCVCMCEHARWWGTNWKWDGLHIFFSLSLSMCGCLCVLCVCLVNLFRLFSLLQTHANEIEWGRMTSIQAQTDSLISRSLSLLSSFSNPALLTDSFFLSAVFFTCLLSFFIPLPAVLLPLTHLALLKHPATRACFLKSL